MLWSEVRTLKMSSVFSTPSRLMCVNLLSNTERKKLLVIKLLKFLSLINIILIWSKIECRISTIKHLWLFKMFFFLISAFKIFHLYIKKWRWQICMFNSDFSLKILRHRSFGITLIGICFNNKTNCYWKLI
jgi:hypothetical protein